MPRPKTGETKVRTFRSPDGLWDAAKEKAAAEGRTVSDVINGCLRRYVATSPRHVGDEPPAEEPPAEGAET